MDVTCKLHVPAGLPPGKEAQYPCTGGCLVPTTCLDVFEKEKFFPMLGFVPRIFRKLRPFFSCRKYTKVQYAIVLLHFTKTGSQKVYTVWNFYYHTKISAIYSRKSSLAIRHVIMEVFYTV